MCVWTDLCSDYCAGKQQHVLGLNDEDDKENEKES